MTPDKKIEWLISSGSLDDVAVYPETCELIRKVYARASAQARQRLIQAIRHAVESNEENPRARKAGIAMPMTGSMCCWARIPNANWRRSNFEGFNPDIPIGNPVTQWCPFPRQHRV